MSDSDPAGSTTIHRPLPTWLRIIVAISSTFNRIAASLAAVLLVMMVGLILVEIGLRFYSLSTFMADALVGRGVAAITFLALGWTLEQGSMIRIRVVTSRLPDFGRFLASLFSIVAAETLIVWLMYYEGHALTRFWMNGRTTEHHLPIPLWIPEAFFFVGLTLLALQLLVMFLKLFIQLEEENPSLKI